MLPTFDEEIEAGFVFIFGSLAFYLSVGSGYSEHKILHHPRKFLSCVLKKSRGSIVVYSIRNGAKRLNDVFDDPEVPNKKPRLEPDNEA